MIKFSIKDDEFKNYKEEFSVGEFKATDAIETFTTREIQAPPQESMSIQEDQAFGQSTARINTPRGNQDFNRNTNNTNNTNNGNTDSSQASSETSGTTTSSDGGASTSGSTSSSGANVTGGEATAASASSSTVAATTASATAATGATTTAASIAGSLTVVAAAIVTIVVVAANIIKAAPNIVLSYFLAGTNYIQYVFNIDELDPETEYVIRLSTTSTTDYKYQYDLRRDLTEDGKVEGLITGLTPHRSYKLQILAADMTVDIPYFTHDFITASEKAPTCVTEFTPNIDYDNKLYNIDYSVFISDAYKTSTNHTVEFYIGNELLKADSNIDAKGFIKGTLQNLPNSVNVLIKVKTLYYGEETIELASETFNVIYPVEIITSDAYMATFSTDPSFETSLGTSDGFYQYCYAINTEFNNAAQTTDSFMLELVDSDDTVLDSYKGTSAMVSVAVNYDVEDVAVYITPISIINGEEVKFDKQLVKHITNAPLLSNTSFVMRPGTKDFIFETEASTLLSETTLKCAYSNPAAGPSEATFVNNSVELSGNYNGMDAILFVVSDSNDNVVGKKTVDLSATISKTITFTADGVANYSQGFIISTELGSGQTFDTGEGYRILVSNEDGDLLGLSDTYTATSKSLTIPDLSYTTYNTILVPTQMIGDIEYGIESAVTPMPVSNESSAVDDINLMFDHDDGAVTSTIYVNEVVSSIDVLATVTSYQQNSTSSAFTFTIDSGMAGNSGFEEITETQWNNLDRTEIVVTNSDKSIIYSRFTYNKASSVLGITSVEAKNKKIVLNVDVEDCPASGEVNTIVFNNGASNTAVVSGDYTPIDAFVDGNGWVVQLDSISDLTVFGTWNYSFYTDGLLVEVNGFAETSSELAVTPVFEYYVSDAYIPGGQTVYATGYPAMNGEEVPLDNWKLRLYEGDTQGDPIELDSTGFSYWGPETRTIRDGIITFATAEASFSYTMTYGASETSIASFTTLPLPQDEYDYQDLYNDAVSMYMRDPSNYLTYNVNDNNVIESVNIYNDFVIETTDTSIYYKTIIPYDRGIAQDINPGISEYTSDDHLYVPYTVDITRTHTYMAFEDIPYDSVYNIETFAFVDKEIGGETYTIFLGQLSIWGTLVAGVRSDGHSATHAITAAPTKTETSDMVSIDLYVNWEYLASGDSIEFVIGDIGTISIDGSLCAQQEYNEPYNSATLEHATLGEYKYTLTNNQQYPIYEANGTIMLQILSPSTEILDAQKKVRIKNKVNTGNSLMESYGITVKGISLAATNELFSAMYDSNNNPITGIEYTGGLDTYIAYPTFDCEVIITEFNLSA